MQCRFTLFIEQNLHRAVTAVAALQEAVSVAAVKAAGVAVIALLSRLPLGVAANMRRRKYRGVAHVAYATDSYRTLRITVTGQRRTGHARPERQLKTCLPSGGAGTAAQRAFVACAAHRGIGCRIAARHARRLLQLKTYLSFSGTQGATGGTHGARAGQKRRCE